MSARQHKPILLPSARSIRQAVRIYLHYAYSTSPPLEVAERVPPGSADLVGWLMGSCVERDPPDAPLEGVRSFALRLGNEKYPHMKLRPVAPARDEAFLFSVDCHDAFLSAPAGSADYDALEGLKRHNAFVAESIRLAWEEHRLPTERVYLRRKITQARGQGPGRKSPRTGRRRSRPRQGGSAGIDSTAP